VYVCMCVCVFACLSVCVFVCVYLGELDRNAVNPVRDSALQRRFIQPITHTRTHTHTHKHMHTARLSDVSYKLSRV
jgi:hypothetical protein